MPQNQATRNNITQNPTTLNDDLQLMSNISDTGSITQRPNYTSMLTTLQSLRNESSSANTSELPLEEYGKQRRDVDNLYVIHEEHTELDILLETAQSNQWFQWASFTASEISKENCLFCTKTPMSQVVVVPNPFTYEHCAEFNRDFCHMEQDLRLFCPAECLGYLSHSTLKTLFRHVGRLKSKCRSFGINENLKVKNIQVEIPLWFSIDYTKEYECFVKPSGVVDVGKFKGKCSVIWNLDPQKTLRNYDDPPFASSFRATGTKHGKIIEPAKNCENQTIALPDIDRYKDQTLALADFFWMCGNRKLLPSLPLGWTGTCTRVRIIQEIQVINWDTESTIGESDTINYRVKRSYKPDPTVYIDSIGQPRGIPDQFKARNEVKSGIESILIWISQNKNTEWINYIYYNQQRFINHTNEALMSLGEQLDATSRMTWQNRLALNWMLADKSGVCVLFGDQCCTYIPNNTAPEGTFTKAMTKLKELQVEMATNAGRDEKMWDWFDLKLGAWGAWLAKMGMFLGVAILIGALLFCCVLPLLKSLIVKASTKQMEMLQYHGSGKMMLVNDHYGQSGHWADQLKWQTQISTSSEESESSDEEKEYK